MYNLVTHLSGLVYEKGRATANFESGLYSHYWSFLLNLFNKVLIICGNAELTLKLQYFDVIKTDLFIKLQDFCLKSGICDVNMDEMNSLIRNFQKSISIRVGTDLKKYSDEKLENKN